MAYEYVYYENRAMKSSFSSGDFVENETETMKQMKKIADAICNQFSFATVIFEGYYDKTQIGNNSIRFVSAQGNRMIIQLKEQDNLKCDAIKFKNKSGSIVNLVVKEKNEGNVDVFILRPTGEGQGSVELQYCFDEIGLATTWYNSYQYNGVSYLKDTFNFALLEEKGDETFGTPISYKEKNDKGAYIDSNINYIYTPLYYINHKQMTAIQQPYPKTLANPENNGFIWDKNFKIKDVTNKVSSTNQVWNFNFAEEELWLWDNFENDDDGVYIHYDKDTQILQIIHQDGQTQEIKNIDMTNYWIYLLQRNINFDLEIGIDSKHREAIASWKRTMSRLFNDEAQTKISITGDCVLNRFLLDFTETVWYDFYKGNLRRTASSSNPSTGILDWQEVTINWYVTPSSFFKSLYHEDTLEYSQELTFQAQKYDNANTSDGFIYPPNVVMTAINWGWEESTEPTTLKERYKWKENKNPTISLNFSISIKNFISYIHPTLSKASILQDNYILDSIKWKEDGEWLVNILSNIQMFITTPKSLQFPSYFSLLTGQDTFTSVKNIQSNTTNVSEVLDKANKKHYLWNDYYTNYSEAVEKTNYYSNITFAATCFQTEEDLQKFTQDTYNSKSTVRYGLILKKIK